MVTGRDEQFMARALFVAERGRGLTSPNPIVGAVVVSDDGTVVGQGAHLRAGGPHAEVVALEAAAARARGATLYVTLEPCAHQGLTPPCVEQIVAAGIARVVYATEDPNPEAAGGARLLRSRGIETRAGILQDEARRQQVEFVRWVSSRRPFVTVKCVVSEDGFVGPAGAPVRLSGPAADRFFHAQRAEVDAMAVGSGTILTDDPLLTARGVYRARPLTRLIFDWRMRIPHTARVFSTLDAGPVIMVVLRREADHRLERQVVLENAGISFEVHEERALAPILRWLGAKRLTSLVVEGGPGLHEAFLRADLVDRVQVLVTPHRLETGIRMAGWLEDIGDVWRRPVRRQLGQDRLIEWDVHRTD